MSAPSQLEHEGATLYQGPLAQFVAERNRLAASLKKAGDAELAAAVKGLPKPSATAWAVDQLWWHERAIIEGLFDAAAQLRAALVGGAGPKEANRTRAQHRELVVAATSRGAARLSDAGHNVSVAIRRRLSTTLEALAALGRWPAPGAGCLAEDLDPPGFDALGGLPVMPRGEDEAPSAVANESGGDDARAQRITAAEQELREAAARVDRRTRAHDEAEQARSEAQGEHDEATTRAREAERVLERARTALGAAQRKAEQLADDLQAAREAHEEASHALARLQARTSRS